MTEIKDSITRKLTASPIGRALLIDTVRANVVPFLSFLDEICLSHVVPHRLPDFYRFRRAPRGQIYGVEAVNRRDKDFPKELAPLSKILDPEGKLGHPQILTKLYIEGAPSPHFHYRIQQHNNLKRLWFDKGIPIYLRSHLPLTLTQWSTRKTFDISRYLSEERFASPGSEVPAWDRPKYLAMSLLNTVIGADTGHHYWLWKDLRYHHSDLIDGCPLLQNIYDRRETCRRVMSCGELLWRLFDDEGKASLGSEAQECQRSKMTRDEKKAAKIVKRMKDLRKKIGDWYLYANGTLSLKDVKISYRNVDWPIRSGLRECAIPFLKRGDHKEAPAEILSWCRLVDNIKFLHEYAEIPKDIIRLNTRLMDVSMYLIVEHGWSVDSLMEDVCVTIDQPDVKFAHVFLDDHYIKLANKMNSDMMSSLAKSLINYIVSDDTPVHDRLLFSEKVFHYLSDISTEMREDGKDVPWIDHDRDTPDYENMNKEGIKSALLFYLADGDRNRFMFFAGYTACLLKKKEEDDGSDCDNGRDY